MANRSIAKLVAADSQNPREFIIKSGQTTIGSASDNDVAIADPTVSRRHARLTRRGARLELADLGSTNGTYVNDRRIDGPVVLEDLARIRLGRSTYIVRIEDPPASRAGAFKTAMTGALLLLIAGGIAKATLNWSQIEQTTDFSPQTTPSPARPRAIATPQNPVAIPEASLEATTGMASAPTATPSPRPANLRARHRRPASAAAAAAIASISSVSHSRSAPEPTAGLAASSSASPVASPPPRAAEQPTDPDVIKWLAQLNFYRALAGLSTVTPDAAASRGDAEHARYIIENYSATLAAGVNPGAELHREDPLNKWYSPEGNRAAAASDLDFSTIRPGMESAFSSSALDGWIRGPFHRLWLLNPDLRTVGYGQICERGMCVAAMDLLSGAVRPEPKPAPLATPIEFPPDGAVLTFDRLPSEWPSPLTACRGYTAPVGLPITLQLGSYVDPKLTAYSLGAGKDKAIALDVCGFDANSYTNPDGAAQLRARAALQLFSAVVLVPRAPLEPGPYKVSITADGRTYDWSFTIARPPNG